MAKHKHRPPRPDIVRAPDVQRDRGIVVLEPRAITDDRGRVIGQANGDRRAYLRKYLMRGEVTLPQCMAGERFAADYEHAFAGPQSQLNPVRLSFTGTGRANSGAPSQLSECPTSAREVRLVMLSIGLPLATVIVQIVVLGENASAWARRNGRPERDGIACLRHALETLACHYRDQANEPS